MTNPSVIRINPALDPAPFAAVYQRDAVVQIPVFLDPVDADATAGIGGDPVGGVRAQASNYRLGDFLTLHDDSHQRDDRLAAFTLGFTRDWRPDWGGQLLFHDADGQIERGFTPGFNVLTLFRVPRVHSVAPVATYAAAKRLSLTGWLVREPKKTT